jgi:hypothetical protein
MKKIQLLLVGLLLALPLGGYAQQAFIGDVNGDGHRNISDVTVLISAVLYEDFSGLNLANADMNGDGVVNISDVTMMIGCLLNENWPDEPEQEGNWVDLGLPSGTLWATRNVGASSPEDYGDYFAWGETEPKGYYGWETYKWAGFDSDGNYYYLTKYNYDIYNGIVDNKTELVPEDDAAYVNWGSSWRIPSHDEFNELLGNCSWQTTTVNGINGLLGTGSNGNTIFFPAAGFRYDFTLSDNVGSVGLYWTRTVHWYFSSGAHAFDFDISWGAFWNGAMEGYPRVDGFSVRPVRISQN